MTYRRHQKERRSDSAGVGGVSSRPLPFMVLACMLALSCVAPRAPAGEQEPLAVVNGTPITRAEYGRDLVNLLGPPALKGMIDRKLVAQAAERRGTEVTEQELQRRRELEFRLRVRRFMRRARIGPSELSQAAKKMGLSMQGLARQLGKDISSEALRFQLLTEKILGPRIEVTEEELRAYYRRTRGKRFLAAHIAVEERAKARELLNMLQSGSAEWAELVASESIDRQSVPYKGRVPLIPSTSPLGQVLDTMEQGEMRLHKAKGAWHVLRLLRVVDPEKPPFEDVKERLRREYIARRVNDVAGAWLAELHEQAVVIENLSSNPRERQVLGSDAAAYVNGDPVPVTELGRVLVSQFGRSMLLPYIERKLVLQRAEQQGLTVDEEAVETRQQELTALWPARRGQQRPLEKPSQIDTGLQGGNRAAVKATLLAEKIVADGVTLSSDELQQGYEQCTGEAFAVRKVVTDSEAAARRLVGRLQQGGNFTLLLRTESTEPAPWLNLGVQRHIRKGHPYFENLQDASRGELLYFEHNDRYHVVEVLSHHGPDGNDKPSFDRFRREQKRLRIQRRARAWVEKTRAEADIEVNL